MRQRDSAICLRASDYSETSQVVDFLTRQSGRVKLLAKGAKRSKSASGGAIDMLADGELVFIPSARGAMGTLVEFGETHSHSGLRRDERRLDAAIYMIELTGQLLAEGDPHAAVFDLLHNALARLADEDGQVGAVLAYFQWRLLRHVGLLGELKECVSCGGPATGSGRHKRAEGRAPGSRGVYFSSIQGGLLCASCEGAAAEKYRLDGATLAGLAAIAAAETGARVKLPDKQALGVNRLLAYHASQQLGKPLKMAKHAIR